MQIVTPKVEIIHGDNLTRIFKAGTTCYRSEETTKKTSEEFARMLFRFGHEAMLEHSMVAFQIPYMESTFADNCILSIQHASILYHETLHRPAFIYEEQNRVNGKLCFLFFGNARAWRDLLRFYRALRRRGMAETDTPLEIRDDVLFEDLLSLEDASNPLHLGMYRIRDGIGSGDGAASSSFPAIITAKFTCSEGVSLEMFRHRIMAADYEPADILPPTSMSPAQESTRYVNYLGQMAFVEPHWWDDEDDPLLEEKRAQFESDCRQCEENYRKRLGLGMKPQDARGALTKDTRTEIVLTATARDWADWYRLRSAPAAHPDMRRLAKLFREKVGDAFEDAIGSME